MKTHHRVRIIVLCLAIIVASLALLTYDMFLDGTVFNPVTTYLLPTVETPVDSAYFSPMPVGAVAGIYQVKTDKDSYKPGDTVYVFLSFCKHTDETPVVRWSFINDIVGDLGYRQGKIYEPGCYTNVKVPIGNVPSELSVASEKSHYSLHGIVTHAVNPFRKISYLLISNTFTINN